MKTINLSLAGCRYPACIATPSRSTHVDHVIVGGSDTRLSLLGLNFHVGHLREPPEHEPRDGKSAAAKMSPVNKRLSVPFYSSHYNQTKGKHPLTRKQVEIHNTKLKIEGEILSKGQLFWTLVRSNCTVLDALKEAGPF